MNETGKYPRPKTRGELVNKLREGVACEVAATTAEITSIMLKGFLEFSDFKVMGPVNGGWVLFQPTNKNS